MSIGATAGSQTRVNTYTTNNQYDSVITTLADGGWVVTWTSYSQGYDPDVVDSIDYYADVYQQRYNDSGVAIGGEVLVNTVRGGEQYGATITALSDGGWVVSWVSSGQDGDGYGIYQQRYNASGVAVNGEVMVNTETAGAQNWPSITALADGGWVVTWESSSQDGDGYGLFQQAYNADGTVQGAEVQVNTTTSGWQMDAHVTALTSGGWVVTWSSNQNGTDYDLYQQAYNASGTAVGSETRVNTTVASGQLSRAVTGLEGGGWVVTWTSDGQDGDDYGVYQQRYAADGTAQGVETQVNTTTAGGQFDPSVAALSDGGWVVTWTSYNQDGDGNGIYMQRYTANGVKVGTETLVNATTAGDQSESSVTALADGSWIVSWTSDGQDVYQRHYAADIKGTSAVDSLVGTAFAETLYGFAGNDTLNGRRGADTMIGGLGNDTYAVDNTDDVVTEAANQGTDTVNASVSFTLAANVENLTLTGTSNLSGTGNALANRLTGNSGSNTLSGGAGNDVLDGRGGVDTMIGGNGNDIYYVDNYYDVVTEAENEGTDTVYSSVNLGLRSNVENLVLTGSGTKSAAGNALNNKITGSDGNDTISGAGGNDTLLGGTGADRLFGGDGNDRLYGGDGDDDLDGNAGADRIEGGAGNDTINGGGGKDTLIGGTGDDRYNVYETGAVVQEALNGGTDSVLAFVSFKLSDNVETLYLSGTSNIDGTGNGLANLIIGSYTHNVLSGGGGNDTLKGYYGQDTLKGGDGNDNLDGGDGRDQLFGDAGADRLTGAGEGWADLFVYKKLSDSTVAAGGRDTIVDFELFSGDKIDLKAIDANTELSGNQAFAFIAGAAFSGKAGQLHYYLAGNDLVVEGDVNGDKTADFAILLNDANWLFANDFIL